MQGEKKPKEYILLLGLMEKRRLQRRGGRKAERERERLKMSSQ